MSSNRVSVTLPRDTAERVESIRVRASAGPHKPPRSATLARLVQLGACVVDTLDTLDGARSVRVTL